MRRRFKPTLLFTCTLGTWQSRFTLLIVAYAETLYECPYMPFPGKIKRRDLEGIVESTRCRGDRASGVPHGMQGVINFQRLVV